MTKKELETKVNELRSLEQMEKELQIEIEAIKDEIKVEMTAQDTDKITTDLFNVSWKPFIMNRFDAKAFRQTHAELYNQYCRSIETRRFVIA